MLELKNISYQVETDGIDKEIKEICLYERSDTESGVDTKELIISKDTDLFTDDNSIITFKCI